MESQNGRGWMGPLEVTQSSPCYQSRITWSRWHRVTSRQVLIISRGGDSTDSLSILFQCPEISYLHMQDGVLLAFKGGWSSLSLAETLWSEQMDFSPFFACAFTLCPYLPTWSQLLHIKYPHHTVLAVTELLFPHVLVWRDLFWPWLGWPVSADPGSPAS